MSKICSIILAAGEGKRMKSNSPKVLSEVLFKPMLEWVLDAVIGAKISDICVVAGFKHEEIKKYIFENKLNCEIALQTERKGTAHAVMMAKDFLDKNKDSDVLILAGDAPFIDTETIKNSYDLHKLEDNSVTVISANLSHPYGYGRIVRNSFNNRLECIVEEKDANENQKEIQEVNSGIYWFKVSELLSVLSEISNDNAQGEYYLPDAIKLLIERNKNVNAFVSSSPEIVMGANDCKQLYDLNQIARNKIIDRLMSAGIKIPLSDGIIIGSDVTIGQGSTILPGSIISGKTTIGKNCVIGPNSQIHDSNIGDFVKINSSYVRNCNINSNTNIGPFKSCISNSL